LLFIFFFSFCEKVNREMKDKVRKMFRFVKFDFD
jgi:hypothetical protein